MSAIGGKSNFQVPYCLVINIFTSISGIIYYAYITGIKFNLSLQFNGRTVTWLR